MPSHSARVRRNYHDVANDEAKLRRRLLAELNRDFGRLQKDRDRMRWPSALRRTLSALRDLLVPDART